MLNIPSLEAKNPCLCGCGQLIDGFRYKNGRTGVRTQRYFVNRHHLRLIKHRSLSEAHKQRIGDALRGRHHGPLSEVTKRKIGNANRGRHVNVGEKHGQWKGDEVGYYALHDWVIKQLPKPVFCERCRAVPPTELANISPTYNAKTYTRDVVNWRWLCRSCHIFSDKRKTRAIENRMMNSTCGGCGIKYVDTPRYGRKRSRQVLLNKGTDLFLCRKCLWSIWRK